MMTDTMAEIVSDHFLSHQNHHGDDSLLGEALHTTAAHGVSSIIRQGKLFTVRTPNFKNQQQDKHMQLQPDITIYQMLHRFSKTGSNQQ